MMKRCVVCGNLFSVKTNAKTCSLRCREINNREVNNKAHVKAYARNKIMNDVKECKPRTFEEDVAEARRLGVSYGIYKARQQQAKGGVFNDSPDKRCVTKQKS